MTDAQIERYSRQIIVPHLGGRGQERLLAARLLLVGAAPDIEAPLAYLVGAGVGTIIVRLADERERFSEKIAEMGQLNSDVSVCIEDKPEGHVDLALVLIGSETARRVVDEIYDDRDVRGLVIARLDAPGKIAVMTDTSGPRVIDESILAWVGAHAEAADFIAMVATAEGFKLLAGYAENRSRSIIEFDGFESNVRVSP